MDKARLFNSINSRMKEIKLAYNTNLTIVAGDFNVNLDMIEKSARLSYDALSTLISDHNLADSFRISHPDPSSKPGYTFIGRTDQQSSRIDGIFISQTIATNSIKTECKVIPKHEFNHTTDHEGVNL